MDGSGPAPLRIGSVTIDLAGERLLDASGSAIPLRPQSFAVLRRLAATPDRVVDKAALMEAVWPGIAVTDDSLVQCVHEIRRALGPDAEHALRTVPRRGYALHPGAPAMPPAAAAPRLPGRRALAALLLLLAVAGVLAAVPRKAPAPAQVPVVAVMPFAAAGDILGDGVADAVIARLSRVPEVGVIARGSSFAYRDAADVRATGKALGADYILEGSVRREEDGQRLRVTAQLDDAATGRQVWAERFDETGTDPVALADEVAGRIVFALSGTRGELRRAEYARVWGKDAESLGAYDYALRAQSRMLGDNTARGNADADAIIREGLALYPDSPHLKLKLAFHDWRRAYNFWSADPEADFASAARLARELEATPNLQPWVAMGTHAMLGYVAMREGDWARVRHEADVATALAPYDAFEITDLAETLAPAGDYDRALGYVEFGASRNPADADYQHALRAWIYRLQGRLAASARESEAATLLAPYQRLQYAITLLRLGRAAEARAAVRAARAEDPDLGLAAWREATFYADPSLLPAELAALKAAGLPE